MKNPSESLKQTISYIDNEFSLRTPAETLEERERRGENPVFLFEKDGESELVVIGLPHTLRLENIEEYKDLLRKKHPEIFLSGVDIIFVEGTPQNFDRNTNPKEIIKEYGEQVYFAFLATEMKVKVEYWDLGIENMVRSAIERHTLDDTLGWLGAAALKILFESRTPSESLNESNPVTPSEIEHLKLIINRFLNKDLSNYILEKTGTHLSIDTLDFEHLFTKYCGKTLSEMTFGDVVKLSDPYEQGQTNAVIRDLNEIRDKRAMSMLRDAKSKYKSIFMSAGLDHVLTWEPAIKALYQKENTI